MLIGKLFNISRQERNDFCTRIIEAKSPGFDHYFLVMLSALIVAFGLLSDNVILVMGGLMTMPLLSPILTIALGLMIGEKKLLWRSLQAFSFFILIVLFFSYLAGFFSYAQVGQSSLIWMLRPGPFTIWVALIAGFAASYAWVKPDQSSILPGMAVAITVIPPLIAMALAAANSEWLIFRYVSTVFLLNAGCIIISALIVLALMNFRKARRRVLSELSEEEKESAINTEEPKEIN